MPEILKYARKFMDENGLSDWGLETSNSLTVAGACYPHQKKVSLSQKVLPLWPESEIKDTVAHEVAHCLSPNDPGHGPEWKSMAKKLGAKPEAMYSGELTKLIPKKWSLTCPCGNADRYKVHRRSKGKLCNRCKGDVQYYLTGEDKSTAESFGIRYDYRVALYANNHLIEYHYGAWYAPDGMVFAANNSPRLDTIDQRYYDKSTGTNWKNLWEDMSQGLIERN